MESETPFNSKGSEGMCCDSLAALQPVVIVGQTLFDEGASVAGEPVVVVTTPISPTASPTASGAGLGVGVGVAVGVSTGMRLAPVKKASALADAAVSAVEGAGGVTR
jgi:hypothetical protein